MSVEQIFKSTKLIVNPLNANPHKYGQTHSNDLTVFDQFVGLVLKGLILANIT